MIQKKTKDKNLLVLVLGLWLRAQIIQIFVFELNNFRLIDARAS